MCRDAKQQERLRVAEDSGQELTQASSGNWVYLLCVGESRKEKTSDSSLKQMLKLLRAMGLVISIPEGPDYCPADTYAPAKKGLTGARQ